MLTTTATRKGTPGSVAPNCAALITYRQQQSRAFRFARIWASYFDPEPHHDIFRHHRKLRHKYAESLSRRLSWDNHPYADDAKRALKSSYRECWRTRPSCRHVNTGARDKAVTPDNPTGVRPGNNIEDAERGVMDHFLFGDRGAEDWPSTFQKFKRRPLSKHTSPPPKASTAPTEEQSGEVEYIIDPITNRKVPKAVAKVPDVSSPAIFATDAALDIPATAYQPQFTPFNPPASEEPIFYDGPPPESELKEYGPVKLAPQVAQSAQHRQASIVSESEEYESNHALPSGDLPSNNQVSWVFGDSIMGTQSEIAPGAYGYEVPRKDMALPPSQEQPYDDLQDYKPVGLDDEVGNMDAQQYADLIKYKPFGYQEPDGRPVTTQQPDASEEKYQPFGTEQDPALSDEPQVKYHDLTEYKPFGYNEPDGKPVSASEDNGYDPAEVQSYQAFRYNEPDGKPTTVVEEGSSSYDPAEVQSYQAFRWQEPDGKPLVAEEKYGYESAKAQEYQEISFPETDVLDAKEDSATEVHQYGAVRHNEPDGKPTQQLDSTANGLTEYDLEQKAGRQIPYLEPTEEERAEDLDLLRASDIRASFIREPSEAQHLPRDFLESAMSRLAATSDAQDQEAAAAVKEAKQRTSDQEPKPDKVYTGNYVRDFPEEFAKSWTSTFTPEDTRALFEPALDRQIPPNPLQPALNRQAAKLSPRPAAGDQFSKEPQGLETSYEQECADTLDEPIFVKQYGDVPQESLSAIRTNEESSVSPPERNTSSPTLYKILAYDSASDTLTTATTTSYTPPASTSPSNPKTPVEVLLHLSNPTKFLPHFASLEAEGFEIVSGRGDVLVFRKKTPVSPPAGTSASESSEVTTAEVKTEAPAAPRVNPIDKTGSPPPTSRERSAFPDPAIGRFASPTGFVNYDDMSAVASSSSAPSSPTPVAGTAAASSSSSSMQAAERFVSGIDVRREEPVFSGEKASGKGGRERKQKKRNGLAKRMVVGAAWVAGVSYALGVLGEYFATGGVDGLGPRGF